MNRGAGNRTRAARRVQHGTVLAICLLLLLVVAVIGTSAVLTATLELRMAGNFEAQARAFQAAEFGIEEAIASPDLDTAYTLASPKVVPASGVDPPVPGSPPDRYRYRLYYDTSAGTTSVPDAAAVGPGVSALHFVVEATGRSSRGAEDVHVQSFYLLVPTGCVPVPSACAPLAAYAPIRSGWRQRDAE